MRIGKSLMMLVAAATVVLAASAALAQPPGGQGRGFGRGFGRGGMFGGGATDPTTLLTQESVQKDLELTDDQKTKVTKLADDAQQARQELFQGLNFQPGQPPSDEDMQAMQKKQDELVAQNKKKAADILMPQQQQRLDEIALQYSLEGQGGFSITGTAVALSQDDLSKKLGITDDQKKKLTDLQTEGQTKMQDLFGGGGPPDQQEMAKLRTDFKDKAIAVLTADQKAKLEKMEGKKFDVTTIQVGRGGFGRGRGRGGPGGPGGAGPGA
jgi:Spy/CpxP family protein refolding chaperone